MRPLYVEEPANNETPPQDSASKRREARSDDHPIFELLMAFCGGGAIKALYATANKGGRSSK